MAEDKGSQEISRRSFLQRTAIGGAGLVMATDVLSSQLRADTERVQERQKMRTRR